jgi:hypothetical protein
MIADEADVRPAAPRCWPLRPEVDTDIRAEPLMPDSSPEVARSSSIGGKMELDRRGNL